MKQATVTAAAKSFHYYLGLVEHGQTVQIRKRGRAVARMVPDCDFMAGRQAAELFRSHQPDPETADAVEAELKRLEMEIIRRDAIHQRRAKPWNMVPSRIH